jgi:arylsulfatase A-like enzyme
MSTVNCGDSRSAAESPNVLLIVIDTLRADHLGCYGYDRDTSPNIDRLSETGVLFENAYCQSPVTSPSVASIFTSKHPRSHGVSRCGHVLAPTFPTLPEMLKGNGFKTAGFISSFVLGSQFGLARGFDHFDEEFSAEGSSLFFNDSESPRQDVAFDQTGDITTRKALKWMRKNRGDAFFLFIHYFDPHGPYGSPKQFVKRFPEEAYQPIGEVVARYDDDIRFVDAEVGNVIRGLNDEGLIDSTLIIVTADHGEGLGEHGQKEHGGLLYDEQTRIPLIVSLPGVVPENLKIEHNVQTVDILPTVLDFVGVENDADFSGASLMKLIQGTEKSFDRPVFLERRYSVPPGDPRRANIPEYIGVRHKNKKYFWSPQRGREELYDVVADARELHNIAEDDPETAENLRAMLDRWRKAEGPGSDQKINQETREKLKALGYVD